MNTTETNARNLKVELTIERGRTRLPIGSLLDLQEGSLIELDRLVGDKDLVTINGEAFGKGEIVVVAENFGVRMLEVEGGRHE
jgi:flagellar motor switch protein FliN/FliY